MLRLGRVLISGGDMVTWVALALVNIGLIISNLVVLSLYKRMMESIKGEIESLLGEQGSVYKLGDD